LPRQVGVDVVGLAFLADPDGRSPNEVPRIEQLIARVGLDLADQSDVDEFALLSLFSSILRA
jgi:hypothetical protein